MHRYRVHDPGHHLGVGAHVRCRNVFFRAEEDGDLGRVSAREVLELALRKLHGVACDGSLRTAVGQADRRAFPGHQHGQGLDEVEGDVGVVADPTFSRSAADVVLDAPACEHVDRAVVHVDGEVDRELPFDVAQASARVIGEADHISRRVKAVLGGLEGRGAGGFDRHLRFPSLLRAAWV